MKETIEFLRLQIEALRKENERLNKEVEEIQKRVLKVKLSDPNFDKPLSEIEIDYELIKKIY